MDQIVAEWAVQRPDMPVAPIEVLTRLSRLRTRVDEELAGVFARFDLSAADFIVIAALRRAGPPYVLPQSVLMERLRLSSGTVSVAFYPPGGRSAVIQKPVAETVAADVTAGPPAGLPHGRWRIVLRAGTTVIRELSVVIGG